MSLSSVPDFIITFTWDIRLCCCELLNIPTTFTCRCNFHRRILLMMAYAHTIVFKFLCRSGKADERCARLELGCRCSAVRPTLVLGQHGGCVLFRDYAFGDLAQMNI
ncbi:uncharacterized protein LOC120666402 isoform X1 [Panicum virgatum]|uniref:uncharacterized protein LOC120666402 isoform X1 n=1 Tax=Panicum virgatum TaxID=38727 RepID=UPI0019D6537B|nr:uncharacterized protein LOC120666402 isoform X1 [Panicum virgatum]